jgi:HK97 family phage prohead protease
MFKAQVDIIKDLDVAKRQVIFAFAKFNELDSDNDMTFQGAFAKTISENGPTGKDRIKHVYNHNKTTLTPIGKVLRMWEDDKYAYTESRLVKNTLADDVLNGYEEGTLKEHSYWGKGVNVTKNASGGLDVKEVRLFEVSTVLWGAQEKALMTSLIKGETNDSTLIVERLENLNKYIRKSNASDDFLETIESEITMVSELLKSLRPHEKAPKPMLTSAQLLELYRLV